MIAFLPVAALALLCGLVAWLAWQIRRDLRRPRCSQCGRALPPELHGAVACWACIAAAMQQVRTAGLLASPPTSDTPDADRLLRQLDE